MDSAEQTDGFRIQLEVKKPLSRPEHAPVAAAKKAWKTMYLRGI